MNSDTSTSITYNVLPLSGANGMNSVQNCHYYAVGSSTPVVGPLPAGPDVSVTLQQISSVGGSEIVAPDVRLIAAAARTLNTTCSGKGTAMATVVPALIPPAGGLPALTLPPGGTLEGVILIFASMANGKVQYLWPTYDPEIKGSVGMGG